MLLRETFLVRTSGKQEPEIELPIAFELDERERIELREHEEGSLLLVIDRAIDPLELTIEKKSGLFEPLPDGGRRELLTVRVPEGGNVRAIDVTSTLTFLTDIAFSVNVAGRELLAEGEGIVGPSMPSGRPGFTVRRRCCSTSEPSIPSSMPMP
jgi:hypothetical protein